MLYDIVSLQTTLLHPFDKIFLQNTILWLLNRENKSHNCVQGTMSMCLNVARNVEWHHSAYRCDVEPSRRHICCNQ